MSTDLKEQAFVQKERFDEASAAMTAEAEALKEILVKLRGECLHVNVVEVHTSQKHHGARRLCLDCGIEEVGYWSSFDVLKTKPDFTLRDWKAFLLRRPFPSQTERWTLCRGGHHRNWHPVPSSKIRGESRRCADHIEGELCDNCNGRGSWWFSYNDGSGGGNWTDCTQCSKTGVVVAQ